jgi:hypothetical protein
MTDKHKLSVIFFAIANVSIDLVFSSSESVGKGILGRIFLSNCLNT